MESNPLLADLESEYHQFLLEKGNLVKKPRHTEWHDKGPWVSKGYQAELSQYKCKGCGTLNQSLIGIFHVETRGTDTRKIALDLRNFQMSGDFSNIIITTLPDQGICPSCL